MSLVSTKVMVLGSGIWSFGAGLLLMEFGTWNMLGKDWDSMNITYYDEYAVEH